MASFSPLTHLLKCKQLRDAPQERFQAGVAIILSMQTNKTIESVRVSGHWQKRLQLGPQKGKFRIKKKIKGIQR